MSGHVVGDNIMRAMFTHVQIMLNKTYSILSNLFLIRVDRDLFVGTTD